MKRGWLILVSVLLVGLSLPLNMFAQSLHSEDTSAFPPPTGPYPVSVTSLTLSDAARQELFTSDPNDARAITVWIWYPAAPAADATPAPYMNMSGFDVEKSFLAATIELYGGRYADVLDWLAGQQRHAYENAPAASGEETFPVVISSNIISGMPFMQSMQFEELASHGYVVIDVIHTFGYVPDPSGFPTIKVGSASIDYQSFEENASVDILFILDQLDALNSGTPENLLAGHFNLDQIGVVGASSGGWPVINAANKDSRVKAGISQDGAEPNIRWNNSQPFMFMSGGVVDPNLQRDYDNARGPAVLFKATAYRHGSFADPVLWPRPKSSARVAGTTDGERTVEILRAYVLAFFDRYLKGLDQPLLDGPSPDFPEVTLESRNTD